jgi:hypothetical protein
LVEKALRKNWSNSQKTTVLSDRGMRSRNACEMLGGTSFGILMVMWCEMQK